MFELLISLLALVPTIQATCFADFPCNDQRAANLEEFSSCTILIPMDFTTHLADASQWGQSLGNKATFNLKVYGLLVKTLWSDIPLRWLIKSNKRKDAFDFVKNVTQLAVAYDNATDKYSAVRGTWAMRSFSGSAFAVPVHLSAKFLRVAAQYMKRNNLSGASALRFYAMSQVQPATADPTGLWLPVAHRLDRKPYTAVFDSTGNAKIQLAILEAAGLERELHDLCGTVACPLNTTVRTPGAQYRILNKADAGAIDDKVCISFASEPHFAASSEPGGAGPYVAAARSFVLSGGNFLAQCHGIDTYESCDLMKSTGKTCADGGTISVSGMAENNAPGFGCTVVADQEQYVGGADLPIVQFEGPWSQIGGSVNGLCDGAGNHTRFYDEANRYGFWVLGYQEATCDKTGKCVPKVGGIKTYHVASGTSNRIEPIGYRYFFLTGHSYAVSEAGARVYLNAMLIPANRRKACGFNIEEQFISRRKRQIGVINSSNQPGEPCGCDVVFDACGVCNGSGKIGLDGCGVCDGKGTYRDYCDVCRFNPLFKYADNTTDLGCCRDGLRNQDEEGVDCGGAIAKCSPCVAPTPLPAGGTPVPTGNVNGGTPVPTGGSGGTPVPTGGPPTPTQSPGTGAQCETVTACATCVGHPLRSCIWCDGTCQPSTSACDFVSVIVPSRGNCTAVLASTTTTTTAESATPSPGGTTATPGTTLPLTVPSDGTCLPGQKQGDVINVGDDVCVCAGARLACFTSTSELRPNDGACFRGSGMLGALSYLYDDAKPFCACLKEGLACFGHGTACGVWSWSDARCNERSDCIMTTSASAGSICVTKDVGAGTTAAPGQTTSSARATEEILVSSANRFAIPLALCAFVSIALY